MLLALFIAVLTFKIAYPAAEVQGTVLLQTAPPRGMPGAKMEAFLRTMREVCNYTYLTSNTVEPQLIL